MVLVSGANLQGVKNVKIDYVKVDLDSFVRPLFSKNRLQGEWREIHISASDSTNQAALVYT